MTLIEEYYEINEAEEVPVIWKILQIAFYVTAAGLGLWCGFTMTTLRLKLGDRCYLYTRVEDSRNDSIFFNDVDWENDAWCDYYQFGMVSSFIVGIIWASFFLMCGKGGRSVTGLPQPWRIVWPSLFFNLVYFVIILSTAVKIQKGTDYFCQLNESSVEMTSCDSLSALMWGEELRITRSQISIVAKTAWSCSACWLILFLLTFVRICFLIDFRMYKICVFRIDDNVQNKREEVLRVTNYEEPSRLVFGNLENPSRFFFEDVEEFPSKPSSIIQNERYRTANFQFQPNTAFYNMTDRGISRQTRSKSPRNGLDEDAERHLGIDRRRAFASQAKSGASDVRPLYRQETRNLYERDEERSSSSQQQKLHPNQDLDPKPPLTFKKLI